MANRDMGAYQAGSGLDIGAYETAEVVVSGASLAAGSLMTMGVGISVLLALNILMPLLL